VGCNASRRRTTTRKRRIKVKKERKKRIPSLYRMVSTSYAHETGITDLNFVFLDQRNMW
jgi:hypothetical protein